MLADVKLTSPSGMPTRLATPLAASQMIQTHFSLFRPPWGANLLAEGVAWPPR